MAMAAEFDFAAFRTAFETGNAAAWAEFFADDAEWLEYRHSDPPRSPNRIQGRGAIAAFVEGVAAADLEIRIHDEVIGDERVAFAATIDLPDGRRVIEHVILHVEDGRIRRQVDVEAWD